MTTAALETKCGFIWDNTGKHTEPQYLGAEMFRLCLQTSRPEHYASDLYWDMVWVQEHSQEFLNGKPRLLFVYVVRECGTNIYADWAAYMCCRRHHGTEPLVFRFEKQEDGTVLVRKVPA